MKKKQLRKDGGFEWGTLSETESDLVLKIAKRACRYSPKLKKRGIHHMYMDIEVCHVKHWKLRLEEMVNTKCRFSFMHDIYMICNSINRETFGWETLGMPRFTKSSVK